MARNDYALGLFAATVSLIVKKPRSCPEVTSLLGGGTRNTIYGYMRVLEAEGLIRRLGYVRPGKNNLGHPTLGPMVWEWTGGLIE